MRTFEGIRARMRTILRQSRVDKNDKKADEACDVAECKDVNVAYQALTLVVNLSTEGIAGLVQRKAGGRLTSRFLSRHCCPWERHQQNRCVGCCCRVRLFEQVLIGQCAHRPPNATPKTGSSRQRSLSPLHQHAIHIVGRAVAHK